MESRVQCMKPAPALFSKKPYFLPELVYVWRSQKTHSTPSSWIKNQVSGWWAWSGCYWYLLFHAADNHSRITTFVSIIDESMRFAALLHSCIPAFDKIFCMVSTFLGASLCRNFDLTHVCRALDWMSPEVGGLCIHTVKERTQGFLSFSLDRCKQSCSHAAKLLPCDLRFLVGAILHIHQQDLVNLCLLVYAISCILWTRMDKFLNDHTVEANSHHTNPWTKNTGHKVPKLR